MATTQPMTEKPKTPPVSISKMDLDSLKTYTDQMAKFAAGDGIIAIRICECCVLIAD